MKTAYENSVLSEFGIENTDCRLKKKKMQVVLRTRALKHIKIRKPSKNVYIRIATHYPLPETQYRSELRSGPKCFAVPAKDEQTT